MAHYWLLTSYGIRQHSFNFTLKFVNRTASEINCAGLLLYACAPVTDNATFGVMST